MTEYKYQIRRTFWNNWMVYRKLASDHGVMLYRGTWQGCVTYLRDKGW